MIKQTTIKLLKPHRHAGRPARHLPDGAALHYARTMSPLLFRMRLEWMVRW